jgi:hypothetical protein
MRVSDALLKNEGDGDYEADGLVHRFTVSCHFAGAPSIADSPTY